MMPQLFLRPMAPAERAEAGWRLATQWLLRDAAGEVSAGVAAADELAALAQAERAWLDDPRNVVVLVPAEHVTWLERSVPGRSAAQIRRALPFAVEEFLAQDVETMHLAHAPIARGRPARCALIDDDTLANWLACLAEAGIAPGFAVPDASLLPEQPDAVTALLDERGALARTAQHIARIDSASLTPVLGAALEEIEAAAPTLRLIGAAADIDEVAAAFPSERVERLPIADEPFAYLASRWSPDAGGVNLLQGSYAPPSKKTGAAARWRTAAAVAALWGIVFIGAQLAEGFWAAREAKQLRADAAALYREVYPQERPAADVYATMRRRLGEAGVEQGDFHLLLGRLAAGMGEAARDARLRTLSFSAERGELAAELRLAGYAELDGLAASLKAQALAVDIGSAEERDGEVNARLRLELSP